LLQRYCRKGQTLNLDDELLSYVLSVFADSDSVGEADVDDIFVSIFPELSCLSEEEKVAIKDAIRLIAKAKVPPTFSVPNLVDTLTAPESACPPEEIVPGFKFEKNYYLCTPAVPPPAPEVAPAGSTPSIVPKRAGRSDSFSASSSHPPESRELEALYALLEARGISRHNTQLDAAVLEYLVDLVASADPEDEDADGSCAELLARVPSPQSTACGHADFRTRTHFLCSLLGVSVCQDDSLLELFCCPADSLVSLAPERKPGRSHDRPHPPAPLPHPEARGRYRREQVPPPGVLASPQETRCVHSTGRRSCCS
jgi:hypothetical protein